MSMTTKLAMKTSLAALALGISAHAQAAILYSFDGTILRPSTAGDVIHNIKWTYESPTFITSSLTVPASGLTSCTASKFLGSVATGGVSCASQNFAVSTSAAFSNFVNFSITDPQEAGSRVDGFIAVRPTGFSTFGSYSDFHNGGPGGRTNFGTLTVSLAPEVPEPATWAMMLFGFGLIGGVMRRRATVRFA